MSRLAIASGVAVEGDRLVAVLERAVDALEMLATVPTPETSASFESFLLATQDDGDGRDASYASTTLQPAVAEMLADHYRLEAALMAKAAQQKQHRRRASAASQNTSTTKDGGGNGDGDVSSRYDRPEVDDDDDGDAADGFDDDDDDDQSSHNEGPTVGHKDEEDGDVDDAWENDEALRFPRSLHDVLRLLSHDKPARDALRRLSATRISPDVAAFVHCLTDLIMLSEQRLTTTPDQDEKRSTQLHDAAQRLHELQDDSTQLHFELASERGARQDHALQHVKSIASLREQLSETQRHAREALQATHRTREQDAQTLRSQFEHDRVATSEKQLSLARVEGRGADAHELEEGDDRKRLTRVVVDTHELLLKYDADMEALDAAIAEQTHALSATNDEVARLSVYFEKVDEDRHFQLEEQRAQEREDAQRRRQELNLFKFISRLQAVIRGFLTRRRVRLEEKLRRQRRRMKKKQKATSTGGKATKGSARGSSTSSSKLRPTRPAAASSRPTTTRLARK